MKALVLAALVTATPAALIAETQTLSGTVTYRERMALPAGAEVSVSLVDVSRADAPAILIGQTAFAPETQVPLNWTLTYDDDRIDPRFSYALQARIKVEGQLMFLNTTRHPILTGGQDSTDILVNRVVAAPASPVGRWLAEDIGGGGVLDRVQTTLDLSDDGQVSGSGGCNRIGGQARIDGDGISFGQMISTMMACPEAVMAQEAKFIAALEQARGWQLDAAQGKLSLLDDQGQVLMVLTRHE